MIASSARIPVDTIEVFHVLGLAVARLSLLVAALGVGLSVLRERRRGRERRAGAEGAKEVAAPDRSLAFFAHWSPPRADPIMAAVRMPASLSRRIPGRALQHCGRNRRP